MSDGSGPIRGTEPVRPGLRLDELLEDLQHRVAHMRGARDRMHTLLDAVLAVGSSLELDQVLRQIVQSATDLVDAQYGALGVLGEEGGIERFIPVGMDDDTITSIGHYPEGRGILGLLIREPEPLRLADLNTHPEAAGFPEGHPPMRTFLGAPVRVRDAVYGNLYLTDKRGGAEFDDDDEAVLRTLAAAAGVAIDNARLYDDAQRRQRWLEASSELTRALLSGADQSEVLKSFTATVREMAGADTAALAVPVGQAAELVIEAAAGQHADRLHGLVLPATSLAAKAYTAGQPTSTHALDIEQGLGPAFLIPLGTPEKIRGILQVAAAPDHAPFPAATIDTITGFAAHAALALEIAEHRSAAEERLVQDDRDRIARDLHDLAIQRMFASGMTLQSLQARLTDRPELAERVTRLIDDMDDTIKTIRSTIFGLRTPTRTGTPHGLRARLVAEADQAAALLGFAPALRMTGLLDTDVPAPLADDAIAAVREALSNAARHAHTTAVDLTADASEGRLTVRVADNGRGLDPAVTRRSGLDNMSERAHAHGGQLTITANTPTGTVVEWTAPLPPAP
ncbi:GAF domain-containing sensor histidine kinase [Streptomyces sp. SAI-090]|jgi:signal transduction histidine kinase|uniref:sensor histidine kinase n=1 Tax=Streptomyces sp. SAI-090 TaxID=2940545 RepID=UPI002474D8C1|nr:GAF domain-containing sensor histidine kinase [Streptomyces sp. SAI-090]MDH6522252.1 two-component system sensor histidine kinase DevS [Streptomyces sp. SAI-090]